MMSEISRRKRGKAQKGKGLVPVLRFPEFRGEGEWDINLLGNEDISIFVKERVALSQLNIETYISTDNLLSDYAGVTNASKLPPTGSFTRYKKSDVLVSNIRPYLKKVWSSDKEGACSNDVIVIRAGKQIKGNFLTFILKNDVFINYVMRGAKGVKMPRGDLSSIKEYSVAFPESEEQQKIADCLSSLDELITLQTQKCDALKAHKKGLMQQLFPASGETQPKLRFPEFRGEGDWSVKTLDELTTRIGDGIHSTPKYNDNGNYHFINGNNLDDGKISISKSTKRVDEIEAKNHSRDLSNRTILLSINGTIGNLAFYNNEKIILGKSAAYINLKDDVELGFICNTLKTSKTHVFFNSELTGSTIKNLSLKTIRETKISTPIPAEQQKIADCLSSLDALITAQAQKIDALKAHKKGLMQQLFPTMDEVGS